MLFMLIKGAEKITNYAEMFEDKMQKNDCVNYAKNRLDWKFSMFSSLF